MIFSLQEDINFESPASPILIQLIPSGASVRNFWIGRGEPPRLILQRFPSKSLCHLDLSTFIPSRIKQFLKLGKGCINSLLPFLHTSHNHLGRIIYYCLTLHFVITLITEVVAVFAYFIGSYKEWLLPAAAVGFRFEIMETGDNVRDIVLLRGRSAVLVKIMMAVDTPL